MNGEPPKAVEDYHKRGLSRTSEVGSWRPFSEGYDEKVYSITRFPKNREIILSHVRPGRILNMGTGPTDYLNRELVKCSRVIATDFCPEMLEEAQRRFTHPNLQYVLADSRNLPFGEAFDTVLAINSILPPTREDVVSMYRNALKTSKKGGRFVATLMPLDNAKHIIEACGEGSWEIDWENKIEIDTSGRQCAHDPTTIHTEMRRAGWQNFGLEVIYLDSPEEIADLKRLYNYATFGPSPKTGKPLPVWYQILLLGEKL